MKTWTIRFCRLASIGLALFALSLASPAWAQGPPSVKVEVVNPLPIPVTGTVDVTGVPSDVTIDNPASNPVLVRDVDTFEPVQFRGVPTFFDGGAGSVDLVTVPADKILVIEHVSGIVNENTAFGLSSCFLGTSEVLGPVDYMPCIPMASNSLNHFYAANHTTKFFAGPGLTVRFSATTLGLSGEGFISGFVSGYYIPAP